MAPSDDKYIIHKSPEQDETQLAQHPKEQKRANFAIGIACLAACFTAWQGWEAYRARIDAKSASEAQKADVERSRRSAEAGAKAAESLALSASKQADAATVQADSTKRLAQRALAQAEATNRLATESKRFADISLKALESNQRPWVALSESIGGPLTFDNEGAHLTVDFMLKNTGGSTATFVAFNAELYAVSSVKPHPIQERQRLCNSLIGRGFPEALFATDIRTMRYNITISHDEVVGSTKQPGGFFNAEVIGCVSYRSTLSSDAQYYTGFAGILARKIFIDDNGKNSFAIRAPVAVAMENLLLIPDPASAVIAN